jgi:hypothetical protein
MRPALTRAVFYVWHNRAGLTYSSASTWIHPLAVHSLGIKSRHPLPRGHRPRGVNHW